MHDARAEAPCLCATTPRIVMHRFDEVLAKVLGLAAINQVPSARFPLNEADGLVLADDLVAPFDIPSFTSSTMDGYAICTSDKDAESKHLPFTLPVEGESRAGAAPPPLAPGTMMRIFTGAPLPEGAHAVIMQEFVTRDGARATCAEHVTAGQYVRQRGADARAGALLLARGTRLRPSHLMLAAGVHCDALAVACRPRVTLITTGDELRRAGTAALSPAESGFATAECNAVAIGAMAKRAGAVIQRHVHVRDDRAKIVASLIESIATSDVVVTIGGMSVGDHDHVRPALAAAGVTLDAYKVAMKPGKPLAIGHAARARPPGGSSTSRASGDSVIILGLPGNPTSALVTFGLFGVPLLRALQGDAHPVAPAVRARLTASFAREPGRLEFLRAIVTRNDDEWLVRVLSNQASGAITSMAFANALVRVQAEDAAFEAGQFVHVLLLDDIGA